MGHNRTEGTGFDPSVGASGIATPFCSGCGMRYTDIDRHIEVVAARQYGAFSREQAFTIGASERFVQRRLTRKDWLRVAPAVYVLPASRGTWRRQCKIAELASAGGGIAGCTAAALHGLSDFRPGPVEVAVAANSASRVLPGAAHRFAGAKYTTVEGIRVTTVAQTLFDVASRVGLTRLERAIDDALLSRKVTVQDLEERLVFYVGSRRPGLPRMRALVGERGAVGWVPPESELEALLLHVLTRVPGALRVVRQAALPWRTNRAGRVDVLLPDHRLIIEADGRRWHARFADFDRDRWRDNEAVAHGHRVMRFTWVHLHGLPDDVLELVNRTIHSASAA